MERKYKILLATDYSEAVKNAERYAVQFAQTTKSSLTFFHAYEFPLSAVPSKVGAYEEVRKNYAVSELKKLEKYRDTILHSLKINSKELATDCIIKEGSAGRQISKAAYEMDFDFIIVGTYGTTGFRKVFYGTHAWEVIKKSSTPVLVIPKDGRFAGIKNIVFATEYREGEIPVINFLAEIAKSFNAEITVLHVTNFVLSKEFEAEMFGRFKKEIMEKVPYDKLNIKLAVSEVISDGIEKFCNKNNVDWLVMSPEKPFLMEKLFFPNSSMTRKMSFHTRIPLLSVPDFYNPDYSSFWKTFRMGDFVKEDF